MASESNLWQDAAKMTEFARKWNGTLWGIRHWEGLNGLWRTMRARSGWYAYMPGEGVPSAPLAADQLARLLAELDALLHRDHRHDYCGIVYADDPANPTLVKVFDPNDLGSSCSHGGEPTVPRWVFSLDPPESVRSSGPTPSGRKRWWQGLFG